MGRYGALAAIILLCLVAHEGLEWMTAQSRQVRRLAMTIEGGGAFYASLVQGGGVEVYPGQRVVMFLGHGFLHTGRAHLWVNLAMLLPLGAYATWRIGPWRFLGLYLAGMAGAALGYGLLVDDPYAVMKGASGAIHALGGAAVVWLWRDRGPAAGALCLLTLLSLNAAFWWGTGGRFAWEAHLAGGLFGAIAAPFLRRA